MVHGCLLLILLCKVRSSGWIPPFTPHRGQGKSKLSCPCPCFCRKVAIWLFHSSWIRSLCSHPYGTVMLLVYRSFTSKLLTSFFTFPPFVSFSCLKSCITYFAKKEVLYYIAMLHFYQFHLEALLRNRSTEWY